MNIILYKSNAEKNRLDKSNLLTEIASLTGSLRDNSSIISPSIRIRGDASFFQANYLYIAESVVLSLFEPSKKLEKFPKKFRAN